MANILPNGLDADVLREWERTATDTARRYAAEHPGADVKEITVAGARAATDHVARQAGLESGNPVDESSAEDYSVNLDELLRSGFTVALSYTEGEDGYEDEGGGVSEPVVEGYNAVLFDETGRQVGEGDGANPAEAMAAIRIPDASEYSTEPPFDTAAHPLSDPGEFPAV